MGFPCWIQVFWEIKQEGLWAQECIATESQAGMAAALFRDMHGIARQESVDGYQIGLAIYIG